jgi:hypothetical protein
MFTYFLLNILLLNDAAGCVLTYFSSVLAPIMGPCIGLTVTWFILRLRWERFLSYRSCGVKTWTEFKMLEIAPFPSSKIHTSSGLPLKIYIGPSRSKPRTKFTTLGLEDAQLCERHPGEQHSQIKCKLLQH